MSRVAAAGAALLVLVALVGCATPEPRRTAEPAPPLAGIGMDGEELDLAEHRGSVVVVTVWASWCGPCADELPVLARAAHELSDDGLVVLGVNFRDLPDPARDLLAETGADFPSIVDRDGSLAVSWGVTALPQTFLIDRDGRQVARSYGPVDEAWVEETVEPEVAG